LSVEEVANKIINGEGEWKVNGEARKKKLQEEGYNYQEVQNAINRLIKSSKDKTKVKEVFYIVGGRYKMTGCDDAHMLHGCLGAYGKNPYDYWGTADIADANRILDGDEIDSHSLSEICDEFKKYDKFSKMTFTVIEPLKKWKIEDVRWHTGSIKMNTVTIEYIKER
jgi:hypothetical protein